MTSDTPMGGSDSPVVMKRVDMFPDVLVHVPTAAGDYEEAVRRLEAWCIDNGIERHSAVFDDLDHDERCALCGAEGQAGVHRV